MAQQRVDWFQILDDLQCTFKLEKSEEENSETEIQNLRRKQKGSETQKPNLYTTHDCILYIEKKTRTEETTYSEYASIRDRNRRSNND